MSETVESDPSSDRASKYSTMDRSCGDPYSIETSRVKEGDRDDQSLLNSSSVKTGLL